MKLTRSDVARRLDALAQQPVAGPRQEFVAHLEQRLGEGTWHPTGATVRRRSHRRAFVAASVAAGVFAIGGSVAALTVARHGDHTVLRTMTDSEATTIAALPTTVAPTSTTTTTTAPATATTVNAVPTPPVAIAPSTSAAPTTVTPAAATPTTAAPTTVPTTEPPPATEPTDPPTTAAPVSTTTTTEVHVPTTLELACSPVFKAGVWSVRCEWSASTSGDVTHYRLLRSVEGRAGRAFEVGHDATSYVDTPVEHGVAYRYLVRAERADRTAAEISRLVTIVWPAEPPASTTTSTTLV